jgi:hypothetical protein
MRSDVSFPVRPEIEVNIVITCLPTMPGKKQRGDIICCERWP